MPTKNPRLTITISPTLAVQLRQVSRLTGHSQAGVISDLLEGSAEVFDRLIIVLEAAEEAANEARSNLDDASITDGMRNAQESIERQLGLALDGTKDVVSGNFLESVEAIKRRGRRTGRAVAERVGANPLSNRGVRSKVERPKTSTKSKG